MIILYPMMIMTPNENTTPDTMTLQVNNFPVDLQKQAKALAALAGIPFREFVIGSIQAATREAEYLKHEQAFDGALHPDVSNKPSEE